MVRVQQSGEYLLVGRMEELTEGEDAFGTHMSGLTLEDKTKRQNILVLGSFETHPAIVLGKAIGTDEIRQRKKVCVPREAE